jgi:hypothetical protein
MSLMTRRVRKVPLGALGFQLIRAALHWLSSPVKNGVTFAADLPTPWDAASLGRGVMSSRCDAFLSRTSSVSSTIWMPFENSYLVAILSTSSSAIQHFRHYSRQYFIQRLLSLSDKSPITAAVERFCDPLIPRNLQYMHRIS